MNCRRLNIIFLAKSGMEAPLNTYYAPSIMLGAYRRYLGSSLLIPELCGGYYFFHLHYCEIHLGEGDIQLYDF